RLLELPLLLQDERFTNEELRWKNRDALTALIESVSVTRTKAQMRELFGGKVPFSPIYTAEDIFADPHFQARNMLPEVEQPGSARPTQVPGVPVKLSQTPGEVR